MRRERGACPAGLRGTAVKTCIIKQRNSTAKGNVSSALNVEMFNVMIMGMDADVFCI